MDHNAKAANGISRQGIAPQGNSVTPRRQFLKQSAAAACLLGSGTLAAATPTAVTTEETDKAIDKGLQWLTSQQSRLGHWNHDTYPTAITALAGMAMICNGSTTTQGPLAENIRRTVDFLITKCRSNGLIGDPLRDNRYTYGHGFSMLFLSQVLGEEEDSDRRLELTEVLQRSVDFSVNAQTRSGGWGYVSAVENSTFDEGSTTITQVQGLRGCRNAGIAVPKQSIEKARQYIYDCKNPDGGISYSSRTKGNSRQAITAAALAALYNAGDYSSEHIDPMLAFCKKHLSNVNSAGRYGHWHYTFLYYSQVVYRQGRKEWEPFRNSLYKKIVNEQKNGFWTGMIDPAYTTSCNLIMLQLDKGLLPIYQR